MKTKYKHICFKKNKEFSRMRRHDGSQYHQLWSCYNNRTGRKLCYIIWYQYWRQYCVQFSITDNIVLSTDCLKDMADFLEQLNKELKNHESKSSISSIKQPYSGLS